MAELRDPDYDYKFQFHKVRLKASSEDSNPIVSEFQFHKVRLKALKWLYEIVQFEFQFHKVRLKDMETINCISNQKCFNSIRYD